MVSPSCPALVIHDDDAFRKSLIATLDQKHFTVTVREHGPRALEALKETKGLEDMMVIRKGARLSIQPVTKKEFDVVVKLGRARKR